MAFPITAAPTETPFDAATTAHPVAMPTVVEAGELLLCIFAIHDTVAVVPTPSGWFLLAGPEVAGTFIKSYLFAKVATGNEDLTTVNFASDRATTGAAQVYRIQNWFGSLGGIEISAPEINTSASALSSSLLTPTWGAQDTLWFTVACTGDDDAVVQSYPSSYTNGVQTLGGGGVNNSVAIASARRQLNGPADDPVSFTLDSPEAWIVWTIGIRPVAVAGASDFNIRFIEGEIPGSTASADIPVSPPIGNTGRAFLIPAVNMGNTAGIGRTSGTPNNSFRHITASALIQSASAIRFETGTTTIVNNNLCGAFLAEYTGPVGGVNEVIVRAVRTVTLSAVATADSTAITGIDNIGKCVVFLFARNDSNDNSYRDHFATAEVVNNGTNNVVRVTRGGSVGTMTAVCYVVEFTGSAWTVQKLVETMTIGGGVQARTISNVTQARTFLYTQHRGGGSTNEHNLTYVWLANSTTVSFWNDANPSTVDPVIVCYVISNPNLNVARYGADPNGPDDLAAGASAPETRNISITEIPSVQRALVFARLGSNVSDGLNAPAILTLADLPNPVTIRLRRSTNVGGTEYKIEVVDFSALLSAGGRIDSVDTIRDNTPFTIHGSFRTSPVPVVTLNGVAQTVTSNSSTQITCTGTTGNVLRFGEPYDLVVNDGSLITAQAQILPAANHGFVDITSLWSIPDQRLGALQAGFQVEWLDVIGGLATDVECYADGVFSVRANPDVTSFKYRIHDGVSWGAAGTQTIFNPVNASNPQSSILILTYGD